MTLCDAGPLFALVDPRQAVLHQRCKAALSHLRSPLITTWPSFTEAMYLAHRSWLASGMRLSQAGTSPRRSRGRNSRRCINWRSQHTRCRITPTFDGNYLVRRNAQPHSRKDYHESFGFNRNSEL